MNLKLIILATATVSAIVACQKNVTDTTATPVKAEIIPVEKALGTLNGFLSDTRSGAEIKIASVETHFSKKAQTRGVALPDAYIVNFEDESGYAVLGANTTVPEIVAVTSAGNLPEGFLDMDFDCPENAQNINDNQVDLNAGSFYSNSDGEYGTTAQTENIEMFLQESIIGAIEVGIQNGSYEGGFENMHSTGPKFNFKWGQGDWNVESVYNKYCYKYNLAGQKKYVMAGCSTVALAGIIASAHCPSTLVVNGITIDYDAITSQVNPNGLTDVVKEQISLLFGAIFDNVDPLFMLSSGTCITPEQIKTCMQTFGFENVVKHSATTFSSSLEAKTQMMLLAGKPVFVSAMRNPTMGHSWVIDEGKYTGNTWLYHCNWGENGVGDGYFAGECFLLNVAPYDSHFRIITYDIPSQNITRNFTL